MLNLDPELDEPFAPLDPAGIAQLMLTTTEPLRPCAEYPSDHRGLSAARMGFMFSRDRYIEEYGFVLLTQECVDALVTLLKNERVIEVGAGGGFLSHCLAERGIDITAHELRLPNLGNTYPLRTVWKLDKFGDAVKALPGDYTAVIMAWPCMGSPFAYDVAKAMRPGQLLIYQGEGPGGCTADGDFFEYISGREWKDRRDEARSLNRHHRQFPAVHDQWAVFEKRVKGPRRCPG